MVVVVGASLCGGQRSITFWQRHDKKGRPRRDATFCSGESHYERGAHGTPYKSVHGSLELDNSSTDSDGNGLSSIAGSQFLHDMFDVHLDGFF